MLDWDANTNPRFGESNRRFPKPVKPFAESEPEGYRELWITYGTGWYSAKELTVLPKRSVTIKDAAAYGIILTQGYGTFGKLSVSTPAMNIVNGHVTAFIVDDDAKGRALKGLLGFQIHVGDPMKIEFRNIYLKSL